MYIVELGELGGFADGKRYGRCGVPLPVQQNSEVRTDDWWLAKGLQLYAREAVNGIKDTEEFFTPSSQIPSSGLINDPC